MDKYAQLHILTHEGLGTFKIHVMFLPTMLIQWDEAEKTPDLRKVNDEHLCIMFAFYLNHRKSKPSFSFRTCSLIFLS